MLQVFGFGKVGVLFGDLFFVDPDPSPGQEGAERGVRLEVRMLAAGELTGSIYAARPITVGRPLWRADLLERADGPPGSLDRAHHHPAFRGWEPGHRVFDPSLTSDPVAWVGQQLSDLEGLLRRAGVELDGALTADAASLRASVPDILHGLASMLARVAHGELAAAPADLTVQSVRNGWL
jgi:hypothetical protein